MKDITTSQEVKEYYNGLSMCCEAPIIKDDLGGLCILLCEDCEGMCDPIPTEEETYGI